MKVQVLGAAGEVGRSAFLATHESTGVLMDYGVMFGRRGDPPQFPMHVRPKDVDSVVITHAHLDHSGNVPALFMSGKTDVYATPPTMDLSRLLIEDMLKIQRHSHTFGLPEVNNMMRSAKTVSFGQKVKRGPVSFELRESGHVTGGSTVLLEAGGKKVFYTGDIHVRGSRMLNEADLDVGEIDLLITESTYSQTAQPPRTESEDGLLEFAKEITDNKGVLFIPAFSVERSQEMACILRNAGFEHPVYMDGMALKVNSILLKYPGYLRNRAIFEEAVKKAVSIRSQQERKRAARGPCAVISPAGMLVGGNAVFFLQELALDDRNGIALVSYQGEGTHGRELLETGRVKLRGKELKVAAKVRQFQFSGHSDRNELFEMVGSMKGDPKVLTVHGDSGSCTSFAEQIREKFGFDAHAPKAGETITV